MTVIENPVTWSGKTSSFHHKWHDTPNPPGEKKGFRKVWLLDAQWTDCPIEVMEQVSDMWHDDDRLHNDVCVISADLSFLLENERFIVAQYVLEQCPDIQEDELILIHYWW